jgi:hypothetical protein
VPSPPSPGSEPRPYPDAWENVAELRVFRTTSRRWASLIDWRRDMRRKGWTLLRVATERGDVVAVFGRTKGELLARTPVAQ